MLFNILANFILDNTFLILDVIEALLNFLLQRALKVKLVDRVERDHRMQQMRRIQTLCAYLLLAFQTEQYKVLFVTFAHCDGLLDLLLVDLRLVY